MSSTLPALRLARRASTPPAQPGFAGPFHQAVEVITSDDLAATDPFILLMDDRLDTTRRQVVGGAHPHAGIETVTFVLEGSVRDRVEGDLHAGDALWMTAGRGVIHNEHVEVEGKARVLQLWLNLPKHQRYTPPRFELIRGASAPIDTRDGATVRLYSGSTWGLRSRTQNLVPVLLADVRLEGGASAELDLPLGYNGFVYLIDGGLEAGGEPMQAGDVGWLAPLEADGRGVLRLLAGAAGARAVLYAGEPQRYPIVHRGPFVAESVAELGSLFADFRAGHFPYLSEIEPGTGSYRSAS